MQHQIFKSGSQTTEKWKRRRVGFISAVLACLLIAGFFVCMSQEQINKQKDQKILKKYLREGVFIYGADKSAPPLRFIDEDGTYKGVVVDYMNQLSLELGVEIKAVPYQWQGAQEALKNGDTDFADMFINSERAKYFAFTDPIYNLRTVLAVRVGEEYTLADVKNMVIATQKGDYAIGYLTKNYPEAKLVLVEDVAEGLKLLSEKKVDAVIGDEPVVYYYIEKQKEGSQFQMINTALYEKPVVLALPKSKAEIVPIVNEAIKQINRKGLLEKIQQKWFGISTPLLRTTGNILWLKILTACVVVVVIWLLLMLHNNKNLKKLVKERTHELESSRNELQIIFDGIPEFIVVLSGDKKVTNANQGLLSYLGLKSENINTKSCEYIIHGFCGECLNCIVDQCIEVNKEVKREVSYNGEIYEMIAYPLEAAEGTLVMFRNVTVDIIKRKQLLQSRKMIAVGQLAAGMAHEIRNPLGIIRTQSFLLQKNKELPANAQKSLEFIDESVRRTGKIIDNVMNFWRESDDSVEEVNLYENIQNILELQNEYIKKKRIQVAVDCDKAIHIYSNGETLKHILINLISNAVDAMERHGRIYIKGYIRQREVIIECQDSGAGIEEKDLENIFNPFFTTKDPGKGTGLGLFIVYSEVEKLSGTIEVKSSIGNGTTFIIRIPAGRKEQ
ncbi:transporter substrate-binding domain-containing protein [Aminipila sp.]|uniref:transporter substrate-binding domain-containing protein n=1 Tax=Aminipila sp. TaxID=2060095 RepID=UPI00289FD020|nr:transporter substrate-binding domain-containing protein [Aminipila sp.]